MADAQLFELTAESREHAGKAAARRLRHQDKVPATVYGADKAPASILLTQKDVLKTLSHEAVFSHILTLKIGDQKEQVVLKALQRHHSKPRIMHIDFLRIKASEKLTMMVPIRCVGEEECPGLIEGAIVSRLMTEIEIKCLPADLPEYLELDISKMELDQALHISDLPLPSGVELTIAELDEEHDLPVVSVHMPKVSQEDLEAEAAEAALAAEAAAESAEEGEAAAAEEGDEKAEGEAAEGEGEGEGETKEGKAEAKEGKAEDQSKGDKPKDDKPKE